MEQFDLTLYDDTFKLMVEQYGENDFQIREVMIFGVDVTTAFASLTVFDEEKGELSDHITKVIKHKFGVE